MNNMDLVSVVIPTYSRPDNLRRAIDSVLNQTYPNIEIIIVDDNGIGTKYQKMTEEAIKDYIVNQKVVYIKHKINKNGAAARNTGLKHCHGTFVNFLDDDDVFDRNKIKYQVELLEAQLDYDASFCNTQIKYKHHVESTDCKESGNLVEQVLSGKISFNTSTVLFRKEVLDDLNGFDETFLRHQDWELYVRFFRKSRMVLAEQPLLVKYVTTTGVITKNPLKQVDYLEHFLRVYHDDFEKMDMKNSIYHFLYLSLANSLIYYKYYKEGFKYYKIASSYKDMKMSDFLKSFFVFLKSFCHLCI